MTLSHRLCYGVGVVGLVIAVPVARVNAGPEVAAAVAAGVRAADAVRPVEINKRSSAPMYGIARMPLEPEELAMQRVLHDEVGPAVPLDREVAGMNQFEQAVFCGVCDTDATTALEGPLPTSWTQWGDAFFNRSDAVAGRWLRDQGCFIIIGCAGLSTPANRLRLPAAFDYTNSLPAFKVCGYISNFNAPLASTADPISLFDLPPDPSGNTYTPTNAVACANLASSPPPVVNSQRDQDVILFRVPAGGISNFRLFVTAGQEFIASLGVNKNFPNPGDINSCYVNPINPASPSSEYGFLATYFGETAITNADSPTGDGPEGSIDSTWTFPRSGPMTLPEGTYLVTIRLKAFGSLVPPSTPTVPGTRYQIRVVGSFGQTVGACCSISSNVCLDNLTASQCETQVLGVWRGADTTCFRVNESAVPCNLGVCVGTPEGPNRDCPASSDLNRGCSNSTSPAFDPIAPGQTICGYSGGAEPGTLLGADEDWFIFENSEADVRSARFVLDAESPMVFQLFAAWPDPGALCAGSRGFGYEFDQPVRGTSIELCVPSGSVVLVRLAPHTTPLLCGDPAGPAYRLTLSTGACPVAGCCSLAGTCSVLTGPECYSSGGMPLGEGSTCAASACCSGAGVCAGSTTTENALPRSNSTGTSDVCITQANYVAHRDSFNGGCETSSAAFSNMAAGTTVCGTLSGYQGMLDSDWYSITTIGQDAYLGLMLTGQVDMDITLYRKPEGIVCPATFAEMSPNVLLADQHDACATTPTIIGDCLPAATYYIRVAARFSNVYGVPCIAGVPAAAYRLRVFQNVCAGVPVACSGTQENEPLCARQNPALVRCGPFVFGVGARISCGGTVCGTVDMVGTENNVIVGSERDFDFYTIDNTGGAFTVQFEAAFYGTVMIYRTGSDPGLPCSGTTMIEKREFIQPNTPVTIATPNLPAGVYTIVVAPDLDGPKRICCSAASNYRLQVSCTPSCACYFDLVGNDCVVNTADLTAFLSQFGRTCASLPSGTRCADPNGDGVVNTIDLTRMLGQFGKNGNVNPGVCE
jgi:hypothetical protein